MKRKRRSLLIKWKWRIITEDRTVWHNLLVHRYSNPMLKMFVIDSRVISKRDSIWWRGLILINGCVSSSGLSVSDMINCRVINGEKTSFCFSKLIGNQALSEAFPKLYSKVVMPFM